MELQPFFEFVNGISWSNVASGAIGAAIVAVINIFSNHRLSLKRDRLNREANDHMQKIRDEESRKENETIQRQAEIRQNGTSEDLRKEIEHENKQKERIQAVTKFYERFTNIVNEHKDPYRQRIDLEVAIKTFRLESSAIDRSIKEHVSKFLDVIQIYDEHLFLTERSYGARSKKIVTALSNSQETFFDELMDWAYNGHSYKFGALMDRTRLEVENW